VNLSWAARVGLALATGGLVVAAFPGGVAWPLAAVALAPLALAIRGVAPRRAAALGLLSGVVACGWGFRWVVGPIDRFGGVSPVVMTIALVGLALAQGARFSVLAALSSFAERRGAPAPLAFSAAFMAAEACTPSLVPWSFGATLAGAPVLVQTAEVWGVVPLGGFLALIAASLAEAIDERRAKTKALVTCAGVGLALVGYGLVRTAQVERAIAESPVVRLGIVQGNVPLAGSETDDLLAMVEQVRLHRDLVARGAELVVWSEGAIPGILDERAIRGDLPSVLGDEASAIVGATVVGADGRPRNAVLAIEAGVLRGRYDKQLLLPFSETLPFADALPFLRTLAPGAGNFVPGTTAAPLRVRGHDVAAVVCCEDVVGAQVSAASDGRASLLASLSNDTWFAEPEPETHLALARLRAVEQRRYLVRATNDGVSAIVDPIGRILVRAPSGRAVNLAADARWMSGRTFYDRVARIFPIFAAIAWVVVAFVGGHRGGGSRRVTAIMERADLSARRSEKPPICQQGTLRAECIVTQLRAALPTMLEYPRESAVEPLFSARKASTAARKKVDRSAIG
jgi:apolipoprotein N-acyltransferase